MRSMTRRVSYGSLGACPPRHGFALPASAPLRHPWIDRRRRNIDEPNPAAPHRPPASTNRADRHEKSHKSRLHARKGGRLAGCATTHHRQPFSPSPSPRHPALRLSKAPNFTPALHMLDTGAPCARPALSSSRASTARLPTMAAQRHRAEP